jgi:hypothetical protein
MSSSSDWLIHVCGCSVADRDELNCDRIKPRPHKENEKEGKREWKRMNECGGECVRGNESG